MGNYRGIRAGWARLAPLYWQDPKILRAGPEAELMFVRGMSWSKNYGTDGVVELAALPVLAVNLGADPTAIAAVCLDTGLWVPIGANVGIDPVRWERHQETEEQRAHKAEVNRERQRRKREKAKANGDGDGQENP